MYLFCVVLRKCFREQVQVSASLSEDALNKLYFAASWWGFVHNQFDPNVDGTKIYFTTLADRDCCAYFDEHSSIFWPGKYELSILLFFFITLYNIHKTLGKCIHVFSLFCSLSGKSSCEATFKYQFKNY